MKKQRPEIAKGEFLHRIHKLNSLVSENLKTKLREYNNQRILEIGGIGIIAEYLSPNNEVRLCEEECLYFDYRKQIVPNSTVITLNTNPVHLKSNKPYYDCVIIHNMEHLDIAKRMSKNKIIYIDNQDNYEEIELYPTVDQPISKNVMLKKSNR